MVELAAAQLDGGGAELALVVLLLQDPVPAAPQIQALRLEEVLEGRRRCPPGAGPGTPGPASASRPGGFRRPRSTV